MTSSTPSSRSMRGSTRTSSGGGSSTSTARRSSRWTASGGSCSSTRSAPRTRIGFGMSKNTRGKQVELSKEFVRQYYRKIGYHQALMDARAAGKPEPDIPPLPDDVTKQVSDL